MSSSWDRKTCQVKVQKIDVETKRGSKPNVYLHYTMEHSTEIPPVATGLGWQVLLSTFLCCSLAGFLFHNYSIALLLSVALWYTLMLVLEAFILQAYKVSGV